MRRTWSIAALAALLVACADNQQSSDDPMTDGGIGNSPDAAPIEATSLCADIADIVCEADRRCCDGVTPPDPPPASDGGATDGGAPDAGPTCRQVQMEACEASVQPLVEDPRVGYDPSSAGVYVQQLAAAAQDCWAEPPRGSSLLEVLRGTGGEGTTCTPIDIESDELRLAQLSCEGELSCRLYLRADGSPDGVCEPHEGEQCSHAFDCPLGQTCDLPASWTPGSWGRCEAPRTEGWDCARDTECESRHCGFDGRCRAHDSARYCPTPPSYESVVLEDDPIAYWRLDGGAGMMAADRTDNGLDGMVFGEPEYMDGALTGDPDQAIRLDGETTHVTVDPAPALTSRDSITMEAWFRRSDLTETRPIVEFGEGRDALGPHIWNYDEGGKVFVNFMGAEGEQHPIMSDGEAVTADEWHHVVATYDGHEGKLYLDGEVVGTLEEEILLGTDGPLRIGARKGDPAPHFQGAIDEVAIYDHALSAERVRAHYRAASTSGPREFPLFRWLR